VERPEEIGSFLEFKSEGPNFADQIFNAFDSVFLESGLDDLVGRQGNSLSVDFSESSLVN